VVGESCELIHNHQ